MRPVVPLLALILLGFVQFRGPVSAQGPGPNPPVETPPAANQEKLVVIGEVVLAMLQGKTPPPARLLLEEARAEMHNVQGQGSNWFFFDFADPNLPLNQFAAEVARNLLAISPLYVLGYLGFLVWAVWRERTIPNPLLYGALVLGVMVFLGAFTVISKGLTDVGSALAFAIGGPGAGNQGGTGLLDLMIGTLDNMQRSAGWLALPALFIAVIEFMIILVQLLYRGISMAIWRLAGLLLIPLSVLLEGVRAKTAGRVIGGFFESWLDIVGKIGLLFLVLALAGSSVYGSLAHLILPAGLLVVIFSWSFVGLAYALLRDTVARNYAHLALEEETPLTPLSPAAERARASQIDQERQSLMKEQ